MKLLITGGAGFIGSNFIRYLLTEHPEAHAVNLDKLTYAGNLDNLAELSDSPRYRFVQGDIADAETLPGVFEEKFDAVVNFAAETHVDRSIEDAAPFLRTNVLGTQVLLEAARRHGVERFVQISTDEVYGSAAPAQSFREEAPLNPGSPYAASKAAADHLVMAYVNTYGLPALILRGTNNYGPYQFPEKLIPLMIAHALQDKPLPVYGDGLHERDWLYVEDYGRAIWLTLERGKPGEVYNLASGAPQPNVKVVQTILQLLGKPLSLMKYVEDRPGHDRRYALDSTKSRQALGWKPRVRFEEGIQETIEWYQRNALWLQRARSGEYRQYYERHYSRRAETLRGFLQRASGDPYGGLRSAGA
ncbi:MAG: dTDP-glucose 4,6-dehydratase [Terriglobia bacterium]